MTVETVRTLSRRGSCLEWTYRRGGRAVGRIERDMEALMRLLIGSCESAAAHLSEHAEGELRGVRHVRVRLHLQLCAGCKAALDILRTTVDALQSLARIEPEPNPELARLVVERIRAEGEERDR